MHGLTRVKGRSVLSTFIDKHTQIKSRNKMFTVPLSTITTVCLIYSISAKTGTIEISGLSTKETGTNIHEEDNKVRFFSSEENVFSRILPNTYQIDTQEVLKPTLQLPSFQRPYKNLRRGMAPLLKFPKGLLTLYPKVSATIPT